MRKLKLVAVALLFSMTNLFASENLEKANTEIRNQIVNLFDDAKFIAESDFKVNFSFTFNANGEIIVLNVDSTRADTVIEFLKFVFGGFHFYLFIKCAMPY